MRVRSTIPNLIAAIVLAFTVGCDAPSSSATLIASPENSEVISTPEVDENSAPELTPTEETPTEETPTEETPSEETPTEETPTEETPTEETPTEETPTEETPTEETPTEEPPTEETPSEETPTEEPMTPAQACAIAELSPENAVLDDDYWLMEFCGWNIQVHTTLYNNSIANDFYAALVTDLRYIATILPAPAFNFLKNTTLWLEWESSAVRGGVYHPSQAWLSDNNYPTKWATGVQLDKYYLSWKRTQPAMLLHEFAHALHHLYYGFNDPDLSVAYNQAMTAGIYGSVQHLDGSVGPAYATTNQTEYFAELTEAIYWSNDYYPFNLQDIQSHDPAGRAATQNMWEQVQPQTAQAQQAALVENHTNIAEPMSPDITQQLVRFIYFVEQGETYDESEFQAIKTQALNLQQYWYEQFGGTFYLYDNIVSTVYGDETSDWYMSTPDNIHQSQRWYRLGNIKEEVYRKIGVTNFDSRVRVVSFPTSRFDGLVGANFGGAWMDGDDLTCILGNNGGFTVPYDDQSPANCLGHLAHELGHIYGLEHTGESSDCMQFGFYVSELQGTMCDFGRGNRTLVTDNAGNSGWLDASPGDVVNPDGTISTQ